jgi:putative ABC transport system ATP-binding protein
LILRWSSAPERPEAAGATPPLIELTAASAQALAADARHADSARAAARPVLVARDVTKVFREGGTEVPVLHGVSLAVARGEIVALEGPSGSGKTTLLSILGCILTPTTGSVEVAGERVDRRRPERLPALRRAHIGFVFQQFNLFPALTAGENVEYALGVRGVHGQAAQAETQRVLHAVGLRDRRDFLPRDLSGGQKQRVAVARALAGSAPILLADEPTANLDSQTGGQILALFRDLAKRENRALVVVTHDPKVREIADRVLHIRDGRLFTADAALAPASDASAAAVSATQGGRS